MNNSESLISQLRAKIHGTRISSLRDAGGNLWIDAEELYKFLGDASQLSASAVKTAGAATLKDAVEGASSTNDTLIDMTAFKQAIADNAQYDTGFEKDCVRLETFVSYYESCKVKQGEIRVKTDDDAINEAMLTLRPQIWKDHEALALAGEIPMAQIPMKTEMWSVQFRPYLVRAIEAYLKAAPKGGAVQHPSPDTLNLETEGMPYSAAMIEDWCGCPIDEIDSAITYNVTGTHLRQILKSYRKLAQSEISGEDERIALLEDALKRGNALWSAEIETMQKQIKELTKRESGCVTEKKDNDYKRNALRAFAKKNAGKWITVSYRLCYQNGEFDYEGLEFKLLLPTGGENEKGK